MSERQGPVYIRESCGCEVDHGKVTRCEEHSSPYKDEKMSEARLAELEQSYDGQSPFSVRAEFIREIRRAWREVEELKKVKDIRMEKDLMFSGCVLKVEQHHYGTPCCTSCRHPSVYP